MPSAFRPRTAATAILVAVLLLSLWLLIFQPLLLTTAVHCRREDRGGWYEIPGWVMHDTRTWALHDMLTTLLCPKPEKRPRRIFLAMAGNATWYQLRDYGGLPGDAPLKRNTQLDADIAHALYHRIPPCSSSSSSSSSSNGSSSNSSSSSTPHISARQYDMSAIIYATAVARKLPDWIQRACFYNPSILHYRDSLYLWYTRGYVIHQQPNGSTCQGATAPEGIWTHNWGPHVDISLHVLVHHDALTGAPLRVVHIQRFRNNIQDARLTHDAQRRPFLIYPTWQQATGLHAMVVMPILITERPGGGGGGSSTSFSIAEGEEMPLSYSHAQGDEKNWVALVGSAAVAYPHYPHFEPHSVFDFKNLSDPVPKAAFDSQSGVPFMEATKRMFGDTVRFSGGTPAVLEPGGGTYLAVGHSIVPAACFAHLYHYGNNPWVTAPPNVTAVLPRYGQPCCPENPNHATAETYTRQYYLSFRLWERLQRWRYGTPLNPIDQQYLPLDAGWHHYRDYFMYFYRFEAFPPYRLTHISPGFKPWELGPGGFPQRVVHQGVVYPGGLARLHSGGGLGGGDGGAWLVAYGEDDNYAKLLVMRDSVLEALLLPAHGLGPLEYRFCSVHAPLG